MRRTPPQKGDCTVPLKRVHFTLHHDYRKKNQNCKKRWWCLWFMKVHVSSLHAPTYRNFYLCVGEKKVQTLRCRATCESLCANGSVPCTTAETIAQTKLASFVWEEEKFRGFPYETDHARCRDDDFPRSRKTDGKRGINHWKRKTYFQTEKHGNVLLTTCCMEICNKSYQIQRKRKNVAFIHALKSIGERYRPSHASCHVHVTLPWPGHGSLHVHWISFQPCKRNGERSPNLVEHKGNACKNIFVVNEP